MWLLTIEDEEGSSTHHRLTRDGYTLGRASDNDIVLAQFDISRRHARLERRGESWLLFDESSRNLSYVNGRPIEGPTWLGLDDVAQLGAYRLSLSDCHQTGSLTPAPCSVVPARLRVMAGVAAGAEHVIARNAVTVIGTDYDCDLRILHEHVATLHAAIRVLPGNLFELKSVERLLFVNGQLVTGSRLLEGGDAINVGGVSLLRFFEPSQMPDPRYDRVLGENVAPPPLGSAPSSSSPRELPAALALARSLAVNPAVGDDAEGEARPPLLPPERFEAAGPLPLPAPGPVPASYRVLRETTMPQRPRVEAAPPPPRVEASLLPPWAEAAPLPPLVANLDPSPSGYSLAALEMPVGLPGEPAEIIPPPEASVAITNSVVRPGEAERKAPLSIEPTSTSPRWRRRPSPTAASLSALGVLALGVTVWLQWPTSESGRSLRSTIESAFGSNQVESDATRASSTPSTLLDAPAVGPGEPSMASGPAAPAASGGSAAPASAGGPAAAGRLGATGEPAAAATGVHAAASGQEAAGGGSVVGAAAGGREASAAAPSSLAAPRLPPAPPSGEQKRGASGGGGSERSRLEARARSGRASATELEVLARLCQFEGDNLCVVQAHEWLRRAGAR
ncbi:MAG: FHA domain-containing protein [Polyangiaceae bacterium]|jgi:pSer/pThr/pTyr-binding forkhead associated (FHA) protein|nr:FHA domain-containing protein [Polyangiaceae bacterium]